MRTMLKSKIDQAKVTDANVEYEGSITIDASLMARADIFPYEKVHVLCLDNGVRLETYAIPGAPKEISINGAAARLIRTGDTLIILSYADMDDEQARNWHPKMILKAI